jgi:hypothetical protein
VMTELIGNTELKLWQKKAITLYDRAICDLSFDHVSVEVKTERGKFTIYEIQELGYDCCPVCNKFAPIVNLVIARPSILFKICDCGYEGRIDRPYLIQNSRQTQ